MKLTLDLTNQEITLLRNSTSDLGVTDKNCVSLQLKIANALIDGMAPPKKKEDERPRFTSNIAKLQFESLPIEIRDYYKTKNSLITHCEINTNSTIAYVNTTDIYRYMFSDVWKFSCGRWIL